MRRRPPFYKEKEEGRPLKKRRIETSPRSTTSEEEALTSKDAGGGKEARASFASKRVNYTESFSARGTQARTLWVKGIGLLPGERRGKTIQFFVQKEGGALIPREGVNN